MSGTVNGAVPSPWPSLLPALRDRGLTSGFPPTPISPGDLGTLLGVHQSGNHLFPMVYQSL